MKVQCWNMDCIHSAEDRDQGLVSVNEVTNVQVPQETGYFVSSGETVSF